jgi:hypothetical protein
LRLGTAVIGSEFKLKGWEWAVEVCNEFSEDVLDWDRREEERMWRVDAPGRVICWVFFTCNVTCDSKGFVSMEKVMDLPEGEIDLPVAAPALPPSFNNPLVVPEVLAWFASWENKTDEKLKSNGLCPSNIPSLLIPSWDKPPGPLSFCDNDCNTNPGTGIWECAIVCDATQTRDSVSKFFAAEDIEPPLKIISCILGRVVWDKGVCREGTEHSLQFHEAGVQQLAIELLYFVEGVSDLREPIPDGVAVLLFLLLGYLNCLV